MENLIAGIGKAALVTTLSPHNIFSLTNVLNCKYCVTHIRKVYGGHLRCVMRKNLWHTTHPFPHGHMATPCHGLAMRNKELEAGNIGYKLIKLSKGNDTAFQVQGYGYSCRLSKILPDMTKAPPIRARPCNIHRRSEVYSSRFNTDAISCGPGKSVFPSLLPETTRSTPTRKATPTEPNGLQLMMFLGFAASIETANFSFALCKASCSAFISFISRRYFSRKRYDRCITLGAALAKQGYAHSQQQRCHYKQ